MLNLVYYHNTPQAGTWPKPFSHWLASLPSCLSYVDNIYMFTGYAILSLQNTSKNIKRILHMHIPMSDATYTQLASMGPHPCLWHQMRARHKWGVMENLGVWVNTSVYLRPRFTLCSAPNLPGWLTHHRSSAFVYNRMYSRCHMQNYMLDFIKGTSCVQITERTMNQIQDDDLNDSFSH